MYGITIREEIYAMMEFKMTCVGLPSNKFPIGLVKSCERVENISKRKAIWNVQFHGIYNN